MKYGLLKYGLFNRTFLSFFIILLNLSFIASLLVFLNFYLDDPIINLDKFGITRASYNSFAYICDFVNCNVDNKGLVMKSIMNILMVSIIWIQYLVLNNKDFRLLVIDMISKDFIHYMRIISKAFSFFAFTMMIQMYQPITEDPQFSFVIDKSIFGLEYLFNFMRIAAILLMMFSFNYNFFVNDTLGLKLLWKCIKDEDIESPREVLNDYQGSYKLCRSPLRSAALIYMLFANYRWDMGKLIFSLFLIGGLYADSVAEEYYFVQKSDYKSYKMVIHNRFIPIVKNIFRSFKENPSNEDKKAK